MDYDKLFGNGPMALHYGMQDRDLEQQTTRLAQQGSQLDNRTKELSNLFTEQNNPYKLEKSRLDNEATGYKNRQDAITTDIAEQTKDLTLTKTQKELITGATKADLDGFEFKAQQMAYSDNPEERRQGLEALKLHKDFVKLREAAKLNQETAAANEKVKFGYDTKLENIRSGNARSLENLKTSNKVQEDGVTAPKMSTDNLMGVMWQAQQAFKAAAPGSPEQLAAQEQYGRASELLAYYKAVALEGRVDSKAGTPTLDMETGKLGAVPPRPPVVPPQLGTPQAAQPPQIPPGAKQIGTSKGRPVYELNGKRFILQ